MPGDETADSRSECGRPGHDVDPAGQPASPQLPARPTPVFDTNPLDDAAGDFPVVYSPELSTFPVPGDTLSTVSLARARQIVETIAFRNAGPAQFALRRAEFRDVEADTTDSRLVWVVTWRGGTPAFHPTVAADQVECIYMVLVDATTGDLIGHVSQFCRPNPTAATPPDYSARFRQLRERQIRPEPQTDDERLARLTSTIAYEIGGMTPDEARRRVAANPPVTVRFVPPGPVGDDRVAGRVTAWCRDNRIFKAAPL